MSRNPNPKYIFEERWDGNHKILLAVTIWEICTVTKEVAHWDRYWLNHRPSRWVYGELPIDDESYSDWMKRVRKTFPLADVKFHSSQ